MDNNFKNPFELDQEDTIISLDPAPNTQKAPVQQIGFNASINNNFQSTPVNTSNASPSDSSMFDLLGDRANQEGSMEGEDAQDPPLLEDIGLDVNLIKNRFINILTLGQVSSQLVESPDLSGPIIISFALGCLLLLSGKTHFSDILTCFVIGNIIMYIFFNFMARETSITLYNVMSLLGYSLLPMLILAAFGIVVTLTGSFGILSSLLLSAWSSLTAGNMVSLVLNRSEGKILLVYPLFLFYLSFALIIIF